jgi:large subunit ribosomal protein L4
MELNVKSVDGVTPEGLIQVSDGAFAKEFNEGLVHQVVTAYFAAARSGTQAQKNRSAVRGGSSKPWRQKGTGRARVGTIRSPLWRGGGVTFAAAPRDYTQKVNKKMYRGAMRCILSEIIRQDRLIVVDEFKVDIPKTKNVLARLQAMNLSDVLIVAEDPDDNLYLATRNLPNVDVRPIEKVDPVSLISFEKLVITTGAIKRLEERLA